MNAIRCSFRHRWGAFALDAALECDGIGMTAIFGPSAAGKTSLLRCIAGLERPREGRCEVGGEVWQDSARGLFVEPHRRGVGYVFQRSALFPHLNVRQNLDYGWKRSPARTKSDLDQAIEMMGVARLLERRPARLSGGEQQRVAIARALVAGPRLLLMDEPLASLDLAGKREIYPYLDRLRADPATPILYVSHDSHELARLADRLALMEEGRIVATGPLGTMLTRLDLALARDEQAAAIVECEIAAHDAEAQLTELRFDGGRLVLPLLAQAPGTRLRAAIQARDVSLALSHHGDSSILNILPARVAELAEDGAGHVLVRLELGAARLLARVTRHSTRMLGIGPGMDVYVQVKGVAIMQ